MVEGSAGGEEQGATWEKPEEGGESRGARRSKAGGREASGGAEAGVHTEEGRQGAIWG